MIWRFTHQFKCVSFLIFVLIFLATSHPLTTLCPLMDATNPRTWGVCAPFFALLLFLLLLVLGLGQLQQVLGDLVVGVAVVELWVGWWRWRHGEGVEALSFVLGPLGLQFRLGSRRQRGGVEFKRLQLQRARAACELELAGCRGRSSLGGETKKCLRKYSVDKHEILDFPVVIPIKMLSEQSHIWEVRLQAQPHLNQIETGCLFCGWSSKNLHVTWKVKYVSLMCCPFHAYNTCTQAGRLSTSTAWHSTAQFEGFCTSMFLIKMWVESPQSRGESCQANNWPEPLTNQEDIGKWLTSYYKEKKKVTTGCKIAERSHWRKALW